MTRDEILNRLRQRSTDFHRLGVESLALFGSQARGEASADSDVDILVSFRDGAATFDNYMDLKFALEDLLGHTVDLVTTGALRPELRESVERDLVHVA